MSGAIARVLLFLLPFLLFFLWLWLMRNTRLGDGRIDPRVQRRITIGGLVTIFLTVIGFVGYGLTHRGGGTDGVYEPATFVDGELRPGEIRKEPDGEGEETGRPDDGTP